MDDVRNALREELKRMDDFPTQIWIFTFREIHADLEMFERAKTNVLARFELALDHSDLLNLFSTREVIRLNKIILVVFFDSNFYVV